MIKAIIFDCFGVLTSDALVQFVDQHVPLVAREHLYDIEKAVNAGFIDRSTFIHELATSSGMSQDNVEAKLAIQHTPNEQLFAFIKKLKQRYTIGMLSNASQNWLPQFFTADQLAPFDQLVLSCDIRLAKPDPAAFIVTANKLGVAPEECVFIDDQERYCSGAREAGMQAIVFTSTAACIADLDILLAAS